MQKTFQIRVSPEVAATPSLLRKKVSQKARIPLGDIRHIEITKRSIDARKLPIKIQLSVLIFVHEDFEAIPIELPNYSDVSQKEPVLIIGAGPAGLFAALRCIELGKKPIVIERGKAVRDRRRDLRALNIDHVVNEDSNYCFGEGGAGTYSDGKLYTRSKKRGDVRRILNLLVGFGATKEILVNSQPHIGTNKLPQIIESIRLKIIEAGGQILFGTRMVDILLQSDHIQGIVTHTGDKIMANHMILATGHSARDVYTLLHEKGIAIEAKSFAIGVRVEHPQQLIDKIQYHCDLRGDFLPPAAYKIVKQVRGRGVYSFCMCPGGIIAPCATSPGEVVTNGWSPSKRGQATANSGIVVELGLSDFQGFGNDALAGMRFQQAIEQKAWALGGKTQAVPAQRLVDFVKGKYSQTLPKSSYIPGIKSVNLGQVFPRFIHKTLQSGLQSFGHSMRDYMTNEAVVHAPESRTSSPVRIPRDKDSLEHPQIKGLYPCGEGAGYAGGIVSAAIDGERCAERVSA